MKFNIFGFTISNEKDKKSEKKFLVSDGDDGTDVIELNNGVPYSSFNKDPITESSLITRYRYMATLPECETAIDEIINETISADDSRTVSLRYNNNTISPKLQNRINEEFNKILDLLNFKNGAYEIFKRWYVDGRIYFQMIYDEADKKRGITQLQYIDPRKIKKIKEVERRKENSNNIAFIKKESEYYVYDDGMFATTSKMKSENNLIKISKDVIAAATSGLIDEKNGIVLSYLHKAIKPLNQLRNLEDGLVIYTLSRSPERRAFYIDVGKLPKTKAEQAIISLMNLYKNKLNYDTETGELRDEKKTMSMLEDYWLPRREGNKVTEIETLQGGANMGETRHLVYFQRKLYKALHLPVSRLEEQNQFGIGRTTEITREEVKFAHFIERLRTRFSTLFESLLKTQLIMKKIVTPEEWETIKFDIQYVFPKNSVFFELKNLSILGERMGMLESVAPYEGRYFSNEYIRKSVLNQSSEEIEEIDEQIEKERASGLYNQQIINNNEEETNNNEQQ